MFDIVQKRVANLSESFSGGYSMAILSLFFTLVTVPLFLFSAPIVPSPIDKIVNVEWNGIPRKYIVHIPSKFSYKALPLVIFLHKAGESAEEAAQKYGWVQKADKESFIVVFPEAIPVNSQTYFDPQKNPKVWNDSIFQNSSIDDSAFLRMIIEEVKQNYSIHPYYIFMTGFSNGGCMTFKAGMELSDLLNAIAPVCGYLPRSSINTELKKPLPLLLISPERSQTGFFTNEANLRLEESIRGWLKLIQVEERHKNEYKNPGETVIHYGPNSKGLEAYSILVKDLSNEWPSPHKTIPKDLSGKPIYYFNATDTIWEFFKKQIK